MKHEARVVPRLPVGIERIAQNRMSDFAHVDAKLVGAAGFREHPDAAFGFGDFEPFPVGDGLPTLIADHLHGPVGPIDHERHINGARWLGEFAPDSCDVSLFHLTFFELKPEVALRVWRQCKDHDPRRIAVESVYQKRVREGGLRPREKTICQMSALTRHGQETGRFVEDKKLMVFVENDQRILRRDVDGVGHLAGIASLPLW